MSGFAVAMAVQSIAATMPQCYEGVVLPSVGGSARAAAIEGETIFLIGESLVRFRRDPVTSRWEERQVLEGPPSEPFMDLALGGDTLAAASRGRVYFYAERTPGGDWELFDVQRYSSQVGSGAVSLDIDGEVIALGNPTEPRGFLPYVGAVSIYERDAVTGDVVRTQDIPWPGPGLTLGIQFGVSVAVSGEFLAIGVTCPGTDVGEVRMYRRDVGTGTYVPHSTVLPGAARAECEFGRSVGLDGEWLVVGNIESLHVYRYDAATDEWGETDVVSSTLRGMPALLHRDLTFDGEHVVTAADFSHWALMYGLDRGTGTLTLESALVPPTVTGTSTGPPRVAADGATVVITSRTSSASAASVFGDRRCRELGTRLCGPAEVNSVGMRGRLDAFGSDVVAEDLLLLRLMFVPPGARCFFVASMSPPSGGGGGLCLGGPVHRLWTFGSAESNFVGMAAGELRLAQPTADPQVSVVAGQTWYVQAWYDDAGVPAFSDALELAFI